MGPHAEGPPSVEEPTRSPRIIDLGAADAGPELETGEAVKIVELDDRSEIRPAVDGPEPSFQASSTPKPRHIDRGVFALAAVAAAFLAIVLAAAFDWCHNLIQHDPIAGAFLSPFLLVATGGIGWWLAGEIVSWWRLRTTDRIRLALAPTRNSMAKELVAELRDLSKTMTPYHRQRVAVFLTSVGTDDRPEQIRNEFETTILASMDKAAKQAVLAAARDIVLVSTVVPSLIADGGAFLIRAAIMVRDVSLAYGHRPGRIGIFLILRHMFRDLGWLSLVTIVAPRSAKAVGNAIHGTRQMAGAGLATGHPTVTVPAAAVGAVAGLVETMLGDMEKDLAAAIRMAQLGMLAMRETRPTVPSQALSASFAITWNDLAEAVHLRSRDSEASPERT